MNSHRVIAVWCIRMICEPCKKLIYLVYLPPRYRADPREPHLDRRSCLRIGRNGELLSTMLLRAHDARLLPWGVTSLGVVTSLIDRSIRHDPSRIYRQSCRLPSFHLPHYVPDAMDAQLALEISFVKVNTDRATDYCFKFTIKLGEYCRFCINLVHGDER